jgi:nuclear pore complex protein Nup98-Nup96
MAWRKSAQISLVDGIPVAKHKSVPFLTFCDQIAEKKVGNMVAPGSEREAYQLAHILFDDYEDEFSAGLTAQQKKQFANRIRKDRLTDYWDLLVGIRHYKDIAEAEKRSMEEAALWYLTVHDVTGACNCLMKAKDYHLATLVAQIDQADKVFQGDIESQIEAWREQSIIPEMSEPIRALYEILAGNTTISKGKSGGPVEDQASTFTVSERFGFDWMQAFALCLWYGEHKHGSIEDAVQEFAGKLGERLESAYPYPDNRRQVSTGEEANLPTTERSQESPLWVLLKLYAARPGTGQKAPILPQALAPLTKPFDARATFQLYHSLAAHIPYVHVDTAHADALAADLAFQLSATGFYVGAAYALMHLSNSTERKAAIKDLLARHAAQLPDVLPTSTAADPSNTDSATAQWHLLTQELKLPIQWICEAKAQFARSQNKSLDELDYLVAAELWSQAHTCLCRRVAPRGVIDEDWQTLGEVLSKFGEKPEEKLGDAWGAGGGIYADFMRLVAPVPKEKGRKGSGSDALAGRSTLVQRLQAALTEMGARFKKRGNELMAGGSEELEERVACKEMGRLVAEVGVGEVGVLVCSHLIPFETELACLWSREYADEITNRRRRSSTYRLPRMRV